MSVDVANITLYANQDPLFITVAQAQPNLGTLLKLTGAIQQLGLGAVKASSTKIILTMSAVAGNVITTAGNYTVSGPSVITITNVAWTPGNTYLTLTYTGSFTSSDTYTMAVVANTIVDVANNFNTADPFKLNNLPNGTPGSVFNIGIN